MNGPGEPAGPVGESRPIVALAPDVHRVLAPNPSPMTLEGTNTWILGDPEQGRCVVVDPGPDDHEHLSRIRSVCTAGIAAVWVTHRHLDHTEGAARLAEAAGCGVRAADPQWRREGPGGGPLADGDELDLGGLGVLAMATPGHTSDSMCVLLQRQADTWLLTGDTVLGRGTTVITHPDGDLGAYFDTLGRLQALVAARTVTRILPGHGPVVDHPAEVLAEYRRHRLERLDQVRAALDAGDRDAAAVVRRVYADVDHAVWPAAEQSVSAQLDYLRMINKSR